MKSYPKFVSFVALLLLAGSVFAPGAASHSQPADDDSGATTHAEGEIQIDSQPASNNQCKFDLIVSGSVLGGGSLFTYDYMVVDRSGSFNGPDHRSVVAERFPFTLNIGESIHRDFVVEVFNRDLNLDSASALPGVRVQCASPNALCPPVLSCELPAVTVPA